MYPFDDEDDDGQVIDDGQQLNDDGQQQQQQAAAVNPADIAAIVAQTMQQYQQPAPQRAMTAEEAAEHFQVWNPDDGFVNGLNALSDETATPEQRRAIIAQMRDGMVNQSFRATELLLEQKMVELDRRYAPALQIAQEREAKKLMTSFENKYPALKGQATLVNSITAGLTQQGFKPKSTDEAFDRVAQVAEQILKGANPTFSLQQTGGNNGMPAMAGTNMGGHGGGFQTQTGAGAPAKRGGLASFYKK